MSASEQTPRDFSRFARQAIVVGFALLTVVDVLSFRVLWRGYQPNHDVVNEAAFEFQADGTLAPRAVKWGYAMLPQPYFSSERALILPPGYPVMVQSGPRRNTAFQLHIYEERAAALIQVRPEGATHFETLVAANGEARKEPLRDTPPPRPLLDNLTSCFAPEEDIRFFFNQGSTLNISAGRCSWEFPGARAEVLLDSYASSARLELETPASFASIGTRWWLLALVLLASIIHRWSMRNAAWIGTDATATIFVFIASFISPFWILLWCAKGILGLAIGAWQVLGLARRDRRWRVGLAGVAVVAAVIALTVDPRKLWEFNTIINEQTSDTPNGTAVQGRSAARPPDDTTHLVLGYSMVNGAALDKGAYGAGALDQVLQRTCGQASVHFARHALDGANGCFMLKAWNELTPSLPHLKHRIYFGGFNDDLTPAATKLGVWISTIVGVLPTRDPYPRPMTIWASGAATNLDPARMQEQMQCVEALAGGGGPAPLTHVYDMAVFDLSGPRRFGRDAWLAARKQAVESHGGRFLDMRALMPGESPMYFNDMSHLSEVGYAALARGLCAALGGETTARAE